MNRSSIPTLLFGGIGLYIIAKNVARNTGEAIKDRIQMSRPKASNFKIEKNGVIPIGVSFDLIFTLTNNLPINIPTNTFLGSLILGGKNVGVVSYPAVSVAPGEEKEITSTMNIGLFELGTSVNDLITDPNRLFNGIKVKGDFISNGIKVPYESGISFSG